MALRLITAPGTEPISLAELRAQCRVDSSDEDTLLGIYIAAARQACEQRIGRALITQTWEAVYDAFPDDGLQLGLGPVQSVTSVQYVPTGGSSLTTLSSAEYVLDAITDSGTGWLLPVTTWPGTADLANAVRAQFVTGYGATATDVPAPIRSWLLLTAAYLYGQREAIDISGKHAEIPNRFVDGLLDPYRVYSF